MDGEAREEAARQRSRTVLGTWWQSVGQALGAFGEALIETLAEYWQVALGVPVQFWLLGTIAVIAVMLASRG